MSTNEGMLSELPEEFPVKVRVYDDVEYVIPRYISRRRLKNSLEKQWTITYGNKRYHLSSDLTIDEGLKQAIKLLSSMINNNSDITLRKNLLTRLNKDDVIVKYKIYSNITVELPTGIALSVFKPKGSEVTIYSLCVSNPLKIVHKGNKTGCNKSSIYIGTENTITQERVDLAKESALEIRQRNIDKLKTMVSRV